MFTKEKFKLKDFLQKKNAASKEFQNYENDRRP